MFPHQRQNTYLLRGEYTMKARIIATVAAAGLAALVGCKGTQEKEKDFKGILQMNAPACENSPYVGMNEQNLQIQCGGYSSACYMMPEDKKSTCYSVWRIRLPDGKGSSFLQCALIEQVGAWQDVYDSYTFTDIHCDGTLEYSSHSVNRNLPDSGEDIGDGILSFGTVNLSFEEMPIDAVSTERYNKGLTAIGEKEIEAMWQERFGSQ